MQLDSKESDIEQLRARLAELQLRMDSTSVASLQPDEADGMIGGKFCKAVYMMMRGSNVMYIVCVITW